MSDTGNGSKKKRNIRTIGINFPHSEEGNRIYNLIEALKEEEDRSYSKVVFRILLEHFKGKKSASKAKKQINLITGEVTEIPSKNTESNDSTHDDDTFTTNQ